MTSSPQHILHPNHPINEKVYFDAVGDVIKGFVEKIGCHTISTPAISTLEDAFVKELQALNIDPSNVRPWIPWICQLAECFYPDHPLDLKVLISLCCLTIFHVDDVLFNDFPTIISFQTNLLAGDHQADPILQCLVKVILPRMWEYFEPIAATGCSIGLYEFINGTAMEAIGRNMALLGSAPGYPEYLRNKTGVASPFAFWIFYLDKSADISAYIQALPDLCAFINRANDILSFYKEELAGEEETYVRARSKVAGVGPLIALEHICDETFELYERICETLRYDGDPRYVDAYRLFVIGYVNFHVICTRYRLKELSAFRSVVYD